ncbi:DUF4412 domain-containing protein, partial [Candidatus Fermentibacteria bacterium]|nr:DUF4412 domain-containing protein [Candidatus Fermentibacteria bacterium]
GNMKVKAWADGDNGKVEFAESKNDMMGKGTYLVTTDGGKTVYLVNPKEKTYAVWDMDAMMQLAGGAMGVVKMTITDPKVERLLEEPGPAMLGYPTTHYKSRTSYTMSMSVMGIKSQSTTVKEQDTWATTKLPDASLGMWLRNAPKSGNEELDKLIAAEMDVMKGVPLKTVTATTTTDTKKKKAETSTTTMEVTVLTPMDVAESNFAIPDGYKEVSLFPMGDMRRNEGEENDEDSDQGADNPFLKKMMKKRPF